MSALDLTIGIDPGKTGAIAFLDPDGHLIDIADMPPATGAALGACLRELLADHSPHRITAAWVEQVGYMPGQRGGWTFAEGYGAILGALGALAIPVHHVTAAHWKRTQRVTKDKTSSRQRAIELHPDAAARFARVRDDGRAEAVLIARHGQMARPEGK